MDQRLAFIFPGQGSQSVGMLGALARDFPSIEETFAEASEVLGYDLWRLVSDGPEAELNATVHTQPAMLAAGVAVWRVWCGVSDRRPVLMAGHSLGEYTALTCAGSLDFTEALRLVATRARLMQDAVPAGVGAMAAILGLEDEILARVCAEVSTPTQQVTPANFNAPGQIVIAGHAEAVARAGEQARMAGAKRSVTLPMSVPSHCPLMTGAADAFMAHVDSVQWRPPQIPVIHNVDVDVHPVVEDLKRALLTQLSNPVRWTETIRRMAASTIDQFIECGPGAVLQGLNKRIVPDAQSRGLSDPDMLIKAKELSR